MHVVGSKGDREKDSRGSDQTYLVLFFTFTTLPAVRASRSRCSTSTSGSAITDARPSLAPAHRATVELCKRSVPSS